MGRKIKLRAGQERADADVDDEAALDAVDHFAGDGFLGLVGGFDFFPGAAAQNFLIGKNREAVFVLAGALDFDGGVGLGARNVGLREFRRGDQAFGFSAEIHDNAVLRVGDYLYFDNFVLRGSFVLLVVLLHQLAHLFGAGCFFGGGCGFGISWRCSCGWMLRRAGASALSMFLCRFSGVSDGLWRALVRHRLGRACLRRVHFIWSGCSELVLNRVRVLLRLLRTGCRGQVTWLLASGR